MSIKRLFLVLSLLALRLPIAADVILGKKIDQDFSGFAVPAGQVLDLGGGSIKITKPILVFGEIRNGSIDATGLAQFEGALYVMKGASNACITNITVSGGSYNGLAKIWGDGAKIVGCSVTPGTGWGVQVLGADGGLISGWKQQDTRRGGIYFGDGTPYGTKTECKDWIVEKSTLINSDNEALFRPNTAVNLQVRDCFFDNSKCAVGKEAVQPRGLSCTFERCVFIASTSSGQQPNGVMQTSVVTFRNCTIYGYNSIEAGGNVTFDHCLLVHRRAWTYNGVTYTLKTPGNGRPVNPQAAARGLPAGKATVIGCTVDADKLTNVPANVTVIK